jgi:arylsulfatase A-like enzyme
MNTDLPSPYTRLDVLVTAIWWSLFCGIGEGLVQRFRESSVWQDQIRAALVINFLLFATLAAVIIILNWRSTVTRGQMVRITLVFAFLAFHNCLPSLIPRYFFHPHFLNSLVAASIAAGLLYLYGRRFMRFYSWSLPLLTILALWCIFIMPVRRNRNETRALSQLPASQPGAPNVLLIVVDTLRADHLSGYGYARPTSPNIDRLAGNGLLFKNAVSASSWTLPSHGSMLTGLYPHSHGAEAEGNLGTGFRTLSEALAADGYRTAAFSANALTFSRRRGFGRGFIHFEDDFQNLPSMSRETFFGFRLEERLCQLHLLYDMPGRIRAEQINRSALRWIDASHAPFFIVLNYLDVHDPYLPPDPYLHRYTNVRRPNKWYSEHWESFEHLTREEIGVEMDAYDGAINYVDVNIANLLTELQQRGLGKNTLIVITSDHGEAFGDHGLMNHGNSLYRELTHVPLIFWEPGRIPEGRVVAEPISLTSLSATVLDLVGSKQSLPGIPLRPFWSGAPISAMSAPRAELAQLKWNPRYPNYYGPMQSLTSSEWHYISGGKTGELLFRCCGVDLDVNNLADTAEGKKICDQFRREIQIPTAERSRSSQARSAPENILIPQP